MDLVDEGKSCEKNLRLDGRGFQRIPQTRRGITEGTIREFNLGSEEWSAELEVVREASFTSWFDIDEIAQM